MEGGVTHASLVQKNRAGAQQRWAALRRVSRGPIGCRSLSVVEIYTPTAQENQAPGAVGQLRCSCGPPDLHGTQEGYGTRKERTTPLARSVGKGMVESTDGAPYTAPR